MKTPKIKKKHGMILLTIMMLSSSLTAFMYKPASTAKATIIIKFNNYEVYELPVNIDDNTTLVQAVSNHYYVRMQNKTLNCIRNTCNENKSKWLAFNEYGVKITPETHVLKNNEKNYLIYNNTKTNQTRDEQAIKELLKL
ncbi:hypothetical protein GF352_04380 [archaeon]|nr:hypothetical protein [archaeon]